jgi:multicomponent Na+:H+ antiporter subunit D
MSPDLAAVFTSRTAPEAWLTILPVVLTIVTGAALTAVRRRIDLHAPVAIAALVGLVLIDGLLLIRVATIGPLTMVMGRWLPPFGIAFTVDVAGALLAFSSAVVALAAGVYAVAEIDDDHRRHGFYPFLMFLMAGVGGAFLTGDIFNLYVWFEVLLISSFGLLILGGERAQIDGAIKYGLLNLVGTTLFLIATGYLYAMFGTLNMADIAGKVAGTGRSLPLMTLGVLYLTAFGMKAAAFPVNFWLPASYHTPRITVAALFAGLLTKVGVYAMLRTLIMLMPGEAENLRPVISLVAILTMLTGSFGALGVSDIRRMLGYWVIAGIGVMLAGLSVGGVQAVAASFFYMLHSMAVMAGLYFLAGLIGRACGAFGIADLGGLWRRSPLLAASAFALLCAVSGLPPFSGFWPKAILVREALGHGAWWLAAALLLSGLLIMLAAARIFLLAFWRAAAGDAGSPALPRPQVAVVACLAALSLAAGLWPEPVMAVSARAAQGLIDPQDYIRSVFPEPHP